MLKSNCLLAQLRSGSPEAQLFCLSNGRSEPFASSASQEAQLFGLAEGLSLEAMPIALAHSQTASGLGLQQLYWADRTRRLEETHFGARWKQAELPQVGSLDSKAIEVYCPMHCLQDACDANPAFFNLVKQCHSVVEAQRSAALRLCFYLDDVVPGNCRRPDHARSYVAVYWTMLDLPDWMLQSTEGWFYLAFVPKALWRKMPGEQSQLMRILLKFFWPEEGFASFDPGFVITNGASPLIVEAKQVSCWLLDGDAVPKVLCSKTMAAYKPCCKCKTVVARCSPGHIHPGPQASKTGWES